VAVCATVAAGALPPSAARTCFGAATVGVAGACCGVMGAVTALVAGGWVFACGAVTTGCVATEGNGAEVLPWCDFEPEAADGVVTAECIGTEELACCGLAAGAAGKTVMGEGLGMVTAACIGLGEATGGVAEAGLVRERFGEWSEADGLGADSVGTGSAVSVGGGTDNTVV